MQGGETQREGGGKIERGSVCERETARVCTRVCAHERENVLDKSREKRKFLARATEKRETLVRTSCERRKRHLFGQEKRERNVFLVLLSREGENSLSSLARERNLLRQVSLSRAKGKREKLVRKKFSLSRAREKGEILGRERGERNLQAREKRDNFVRDRLKRRWSGLV